MVLERINSSIEKLIKRRGEDLAIASVLLIFTSLNFHALWDLRIFGHVEISLYLIASVLVIAFWLAVAVFNHLPPLSSRFRWVLGWGIVFLAWLGIQGFRSPDPIRGFTLLAQAVRNIMLLWLLGRAFSLVRDFGKLNKWVFLIGVPVSVTSILMFFWLSRDYLTILATEYMWEPRLFYELAEMGILRLEGFAGDPNFYSLWIIPSFLGGISFLPRIRGADRFWVFSGLMAISYSLVLAMSRGLVLAFPLALVLILGFWFFSPRVRENASSYIKYILILGFLTVPLTIIPLPGIGQTPAHFTLLRMGIVDTTPRFKSWNILLESGKLPADQITVAADSRSIGDAILLESGKLPADQITVAADSRSIGDVIFGSGLRSAEVSLEGQYSHNSYLDLLIEAGLVGLLLWVVFLIFVSRRYLGMIGSSSMLPWIHTWFLVLVFIFWFSLAYNPFLWILASMVVSNRDEER